MVSLTVLRAPGYVWNGKFMEWIRTWVVEPEPQDGILLGVRDD